MTHESQIIKLEEGMTIVIPQENILPPYSLFAMMVFASRNFGGKPVTCEELLPNIHLNLSFEREVPLNEQELKQAWGLIQMYLSNWIELPAHSEKGSLSFDHFKLDFTYGKRPVVGTVHFERCWPLH